MFSVLAIAAFGSSAYAGDFCAESADSDALRGYVDMVEAGWVQMDVEPVKSGAEKLRAGVACAEGILVPEEAAKIHRAIGLGHVASANLDAAARSFAAARFADPTLRMTEALAPLGTPVRALYERPAPYVTSNILDSPHQGSLVIDGVTSQERPGGRPIILQHVSPSGRLVGTWWVEVGADLPRAPWQDRHKATRRLVRGIGFLAALGGGSLLVAGAWTKRTHSDPARVDKLTVSDLERLRDQSRVFTATGVGLAVLGGTGLGVSFSSALR